MKGWATLVTERENCWSEFSRVVHSCGRLLYVWSTHKLPREAVCSSASFNPACCVGSVGFALRVAGSSSATGVIQVQWVWYLAGQKISFQEVQRRELAK